MLQSCLLCETVELSARMNILVLNSAADPFVAYAQKRVRSGTIVLAEDNITTLPSYKSFANIRTTSFHDYILHSSETHVDDAFDAAVLNVLYQPSKSWILYALQIAARTLKVGGKLYVTGAKDRGILSIGKHMEEIFGNVETLAISKGHRVLRSDQSHRPASNSTSALEGGPMVGFAESKLDEGTRLLLETLEVRVTDDALDLGCGAGYIGLHIARRASKGHVTMVDASLAAVSASRQAVLASGLSHVDVLPSDGVQAVQKQRFDLVVTNPPFHLGGEQTTRVAEEFMRGAASVLRPQGRFYLVANRFLRYEPVLKAHFQRVEEVDGNSKFKVLRAQEPSV